MDKAEEHAEGVELGVLLRNAVLFGRVQHAPEVAPLAELHEEVDFLRVPIGAVELDDEGRVASVQCALLVHHVLLLPLGDDLGLAKSLQGVALGGRKQSRLLARLLVLHEGDTPWERRVVDSSLKVQ